MAGAAALLAVRVVQATRRWPLGVLAGVVFAVTPIAWRLSTRADAHALHVLLAALILVLLAGWQQRHRRADPRAGRWLVAAALVYGLALGNHALTVLLAPGVAAFVLLVAPRILWRQWRLVLLCLAVLTLTTVAVYAYLPLRSAMDPPLDYADAATWRGFWYIVMGQQFQGAVGGLPPLVDVLTGAWDLVVRDLGALAILVPAGAILGAVRHPRLVVLTGLWFACTWVFASGYPNASIERYYLVPLLAAATWVALAADVVWDALLALVDAVARRTASSARSDLVRRAARILPVLLVTASAADESARPAGATGRGRCVDETFGRDWLEATLAALPPGRHGRLVVVLFDPALVRPLGRGAPAGHHHRRRQRRSRGGLRNGGGSHRPLPGPRARLCHPARAGPARPGPVATSWSAWRTSPALATSIASSAGARKDEAAAHRIRACLT